MHLQDCGMKLHTMLFKHAAFKLQKHNYLGLIIILCWF